ncbi:MAG: hypothetical protein SGJ00_11665 [bacterium]|nr:hypothetical protein [bacterium]
MILLGACNSNPRSNLPQTGSFGESFTSDVEVMDVNAFVIADTAMCLPFIKLAALLKNIVREKDVG